jgi:hypothetical protein
MGYGTGVEPSLKPKSRFPATVAVLALLAGGGGAAWKFLGHHASEARVGVSSDPNRRFYIHVKSTPDGANIYTDDGKREQLMGSTPVTLPIDLTGVSSVKLKLKKPGFEDYEQIVVDETPLSISLTPAGGAPTPPPTPAPEAAPGAGAKEPAGGTTTSSGTGSAATDSSSSRPHRHRSHKPSSDAPAPKPDEPAGGEIE